MAKKKSEKIRLLVVEPGKKPRVEEVVPDGWKTWYPLIDKTTHLFQQFHLLPNIEMLFDEEGRRKEFPLNVLLPGPAPRALAPGEFFIDMTKGKGMQPGEPGIGYHEILGTFLIARTRGSVYVTLTDEDIAKFTEALSYGRA